MARSSSDRVGNPDDAVFEDWARSSHQISVVVGDSWNSAIGIGQRIQKVQIQTPDLIDIATTGFTFRTEEIGTSVNSPS